MLKNYIKIALKVLLRRKFFTFISLFGISFTLVVLMIATAFFDHLFAPFPPENKSERSLSVFTIRLENIEKGNAQTGPPSYAFLDRYVRTLPEVEKVSISTRATTALSFNNGERIKSEFKRTDGEFWQIMDFDFLEGGPFTADDEKNANFVAVINAATRQKFFGKESALGKTIEVDGQSFRVVGVVANVPIFRQLPFADIWVPLSTSKGKFSTQELVGNCMGVILAKSRDDLDRIRADFKAKLAQVEFSDPKAVNTIYGAAETQFENVARELFANNRSNESYAPQLLALIVLLMILFMLLPTINLVNINLSRIMERASEIGVRKAFGASSWKLVGQFIVENVLQTLVGGVIGFVLSYLVLQMLTQSGLIQYAVFHLNYRLFLYGLAIALFFGIFSGAYPAWKMSRLHPVEALRGKSL
jgi:putative ABC transport system permease protein